MLLVKALLSRLVAGFLFSSFLILFFFVSFQSFQCCVDSIGESSYQYHWRPNFEPKQFDFDETLRTQGLDPDYSKRQLFDLIKGGGTIGWTLCIQTMSPEEATKTSFDPFDVTKIWPRGESSSSSSLSSSSFTFVSLSTLCKYGSMGKQANRQASSLCRKLAFSN